MKGDPILRAAFTPSDAARAAQRIAKFTLDDNESTPAQKDWAHSILSRDTIGLGNELVREEAQSTDESNLSARRPNLPAAGADPDRERRVWRIGVVDDDWTARYGMLALMQDHEDLAPVAHSDTVTELLASEDEFDLVVLDLTLADETTPIENLDTLRTAEIPVLIYNSTEHAALLRTASRALSLGKALDSDEYIREASLLIEAVRSAAQGRAQVTTELTASLDSESDPRLPAVDLPPQLRLVFKLYVSGERPADIAITLKTSPEEIDDYLRRIRRTYDDAGRPTKTTASLVLRAIEDGWVPMPARRGGHGKHSVGDERQRWRGPLR